MSRLSGGLKRMPLPLLLALVVAVGATVVLVVQIAVIPPPPAIVAPIETAPTAVESGTHTITLSMTIYAGQTARYSTLAALGYTSLQANTTGWHFQVNDWLFAVMRRDTGNATFTLPNNVVVDVFQYNSSHALIVNRQRNTVVIAKIVTVGGTGWYAYHPVTTNYDSQTINGLTRYMQYRGLSQVHVFRPRQDYVTFDPSTKVFRVFFDVVNSAGQVSQRGTSITNSTNFTVMDKDAVYTPSDTYFIIDIHNVVLAPIWVIHMSSPTSSVRTALTITPRLPP
jgi:hypothetical protein